MIRLLILVSIFFAHFSSNALAYLKDYPPYKFEDGPPYHLQVQALIDSTKSEYVSSDRKISASLNKTKSGIELLVKDNEIIVVSKKTNKLPVPYAVYRTDIDGDGLNDFIVFYNYRDWFRNGIKEDKVEIFLKQNEGAYQMIAYDAISVGLEDFVDLNGDGKYEVIITKMDQIKKGNFFIYNIYEFDGFRLLNSDAKFKGFSKLIRYFLRPNDSDDLSLSQEERLELSDKNNKAIQQKTIPNKKSPAVIKPKEVVGIEAGELSKELSQKSEAIKTLEDKEQKLIARIEAKERKFQEAIISEKNDQKMLEARVKELSDKLIIFEKNMKIREEENQNLQAAIETREKEFQEATANKDMKHQEALMTKIKELSERLVLNVDAIRALKDKDLELKSQFQGKEVEFQEVIAAKDKEQRDGLEDRIEELSDKLVVLGQNMKDMKEKGQILKSTLETKVERLTEASALKDKTIEKLKDGEQGLRAEVENSKLELKNALEAKEKEYQEVLETSVEELSGKLVLLDVTINTLKEENHNLQSRFEAKEAEIKEIFVVQDKQRQEVLESRILALEDKERELKTHLADKESQLEEAFAGMNKKHQEKMEVRIEDLSGRLAVFNKHLNALEEEGRNINSRLEARENKVREALVIKDRNQKETLNNRFMELLDRFALLEKNINALEEDGQIMQGKLETKVEGLAEALALKDKTIEKLKDGEQGLRAEVENSKLELKNALEAKEKEYQEVLETSVEELSERLALLNVTINALKEENQNLQSRFEAKEAEIEEIFVVQDKQRQEVLESRILALEDKERELKTHLADKESQLEEAFAGMNKKHQEKMEVRIEDLTEKLGLKDEAIEALKVKGQGLRAELKNIKVEFQDALEAKDTEHKEASKTMAKEISDKLLVFEKNMKALGEKGQHLESRLEANKVAFQEVLAVKGREYQELSGSNDVKIEDLNEKMALKDEVIKKLEEKEQQLKAQFEGKGEELQQAIVAKDRKHQEVLETRIQELSDKLTVFDMTIKALKEENQKLQARFESKDKEYQDTLVTKDMQFQAFLKSKIKELSEEWLKSLGSLSEEKSLVNVGTVDMQRVIEESKKGREARKFFEGLISMRSEEELAKTEGKLISEIVKDIAVVVQQYAKEHGITYVVDGVSGGVVHINKKLDITDEIIDLYNEMVETSKQEGATIK